MRRQIGLLSNPLRQVFEGFRKMRRGSSVSALYLSLRGSHSNSVWKRSVIPSFSIDCVLIYLVQVTGLTVSMLLQRLRSAEPTVEAAIAYNLVDLAISAPESSFADIIRVFSSINRTANPDDPRFSNNMVIISLILHPTLLIGYKGACGTN